MVETIATLATIVSNDGYHAPIVATWLPFLALFYAVLLAAIICTVAFKDARRSHLD